MISTPLRRVIALAGLATFLATFAENAQNEPWPPAVSREDEGAPALSAEDSRRTIVLPPGYRVELVAQEPLVQDPIVIDFDPDGRLWVVEMPAFAVGESMRDSREGICRVAVLEDVDDDGVMDRRTVFADGLVLPRAIKTLKGGAALVGEPPHLWLMRDTDGDLRMDEKQEVTNTFGQRDANPEHNANSLIWGLDNWLYTSEHDSHLRYRGGRFEVVPTLARGQWGGSIDDAGRVYRNVNNGPLFVDFTLARYFTRNPNVVRTRGLYEPLIALEAAEAWPIRPTRGVNRGYRDQFFRPDGSSRILQSAATPVVFRGDRLPRELQGGVFVTDSTTNLVHWLKLVDDGTGRFHARNGFARGEIFASRDERLRPVGAASAPDGTLYVVDMYRGVVQDVEYQTEYLRDYIRKNQLTGPNGRGRIWRIVHATTVRDKKPSLSKESPAGLVSALSHPNGWWRDTAQQLLVQRGDVSVVPALRDLVRKGTDWRARLHALGVLDGLSALDPKTLLPLLADPTPEVRAWGIRWSEPWLARPEPEVAQAVLKRLDDPHWTVRVQVAASVGELPWPLRCDPALHLLRRYGDDPIMVDAVLSGLPGKEEEVLDLLLLGPGRSPAAGSDPADALAMLAGAVARSAKAAAVARLLQRVGSPELSTAPRLALLRGLEAGLGPKGLPAEPRPLTKLEAEPGEVGVLARQVALRLDWPGKPARAAEAPALTSDEQALFEAGRRLYGNLCVACHLADGRGQERIAPALVGSPRVVGDPGIPVRIVLSGLEGEVGLMPPLPSLEDKDVASILTYLRRAWGHTAGAVAPAEVREIRGLTRVRTRPWTPAELDALTRR